LRAVALFIAVSVAVPHAQSLQGTVARNTNEPAPALSNEAASTEVQLLVGRSTVISVGQPITRVSLTTANIADVMVTSPQQLLLHGKSPGTISLFVWDRAGGITRYEVMVQRDLNDLGARLAQLFPGESITVTSNGKDVVLAGSVSGKYVVEKAVEVAAGYVEKKENVVNLLKQQDGVATRQVLLRVRFAEVSRSALTELGVNLAANGFDHGRWFGRTTTQQFASPFWNDRGEFVFSDFLNLFLFDTKNQLASSIRLLQEKGLFQSLAEPNLIAEDGKEASFLAGGEYPYPVVQGQAGGTSVTIQFKEFGIKLNFIPNIVGTDLVNLKVRPEVSSLDFANAIVLNGFRVPAISSRRTETEVELQDGQTFAVAGLLNNTMTQQMSKIPGIGDIPVLGYLFRSKAARKDQTELVVMITPQILRRNSTGVSSTIPNLVEPFMAPPAKTLPPPAPWNLDARPQSSTTAPAAPAAGSTTLAPATPSAVPVDQRPAAEAVATPTPATVAQPAPQDPSGQQTSEPAAAEPVAPKQAAPQQMVSEQQQSATDRRAAEKQTQREKAAAEKQARELQAQMQKQARAIEAQAQKQAEVDRKKAEQDRRAAAEQAVRDRKAAEAKAKADAKKAAEEKKQAEKAAKEQARLDEELQKRQAEAAKRKAETDKERGTEIAKAEQKLKAAQTEYEAALGQKQ